MKNKKLDRFDFFVFGLALAFLISLTIGYYHLDTLEEKVNEFIDLPSKCYTNLTPSGYFTSPVLKPITLNNNSFLIEGDDKLDIVQTKGTGSMNPLMRKGSILIYVYPKKVAIGDILIYKNGNESIVHRVINITDEGFVLKGDNNLLADEGIVTEDMIEGEVVGILWLFRIFL
jgi:hypothetical protein